MAVDLNWFQLGPIPNNVIQGHYVFGLVVLSYIIAVLASYVALDLSGRLRVEQSHKTRMYWLLGGAFAMGAGIWSMHFVGMLAFLLPMPMKYEIFWTISSMIAAIIASGFALFLFGKVSHHFSSTFLWGGVILGLAIVTMHYMGMQGMTEHVRIRYLPGLFFLSIVVAILASELTFWLMLKSNIGTYKKQLQLKIGSALVMGLGICGMHYIGMAAAVFTPLTTMKFHMSIGIPPYMLAFYITAVTAIIISVALIASTYKQLMASAVQNEKNFLNAMLDNLDDGIIAYDAKGKMTLVNLTLQRRLNMPKDKKNREIWDYFELQSIDNNHKIDKENIPIFRILKGETIHDLELLMILRNGSRRNVVIDGQPIVNTEGKRLGAVIVIHDITERKNIERMKNEFVSVVSHELRTPLTSIRGSLGLLLGGTVGAFPEKARKLLEIAGNNCERLLLLINDILDIEKIEAGKIDFQSKVINLNELINEAVVTNKMYAEKYNVHIVYHSSSSDIKVFADSDRLMQVLTNLISNAVKFSPAGETVKIETKVTGSEVRVAVIDKGSGVPADFQSKIFEKFSQADTSDTRKKTGTGLGLSISRAIIEHLGGTLSFSSPAHGPTTFYFDLPIWRETEFVKVANEKTKTTEPKHKLLICEDDEDQANYLSALLEASGYENDIALTATDAKKRLAKNGYSALLLDLILPDQDGIAFIRELRASERTRNLPIIVLSVIAQTGKALLNGDAFFIVDWLDKPIDLNRLLNSIKTINKTLATSKPHILHVEDDIDTQQVIATLLEDEAKIVGAATLQEAREKLNREHYDLVILDLLLPDGNSVELLPQLAKNKTPVIVYSAIELDREYSQYVTAALVKSNISNETLVSKIKNILNGYTG